MTPPDNTWSPMMPRLRPRRTAPTIWGRKRVYSMGYERGTEGSSKILRQISKTTWRTSPGNVNARMLGGDRRRPLMEKEGKKRMGVQKETGITYQTQSATARSIRGRHQFVNRAHFLSCGLFVLDPTHAAAPVSLLRVVWFFGRLITGASADSPNKRSTRSPAASRIALSSTRL